MKAQPRRDNASATTRHSWLAALAIALAMIGLGHILSPAAPGATPVPTTPQDAEKPQAEAQPERDYLAGGIGWINTANPIRLPDLKGKIVLLDFWTYCCINCHHVIPDLEKLEKKYPNELVVIGVHSPKFEAERDTDNIRAKVAEYKIKHPVVNDADMILWRRFGVNGWPTLVLIDASGTPVLMRSGEGQYELFDRAISILIEQAKKDGTLNETPFVIYAESDKPSTGPLLYPGKVLADAPGNRLFIGDTGHHRIVVTTLDGQAIATIGTGEPGLKDGPFNQAQFHRPQGMCLVGDTLYIADTENHALRAVDLKTQTVTTLAGDGRQAYRRSGSGPGKTTGLNSPWDVLPIPGTTKLALAMAGPHQLWTYDTATGTIAVWAGSGREDIIDGSYAEAAFAQPSGLATDGQDLFVADSEVSGVRAVSLTDKGDKSIRSVVGMGLFEFGDIDGTGDTVRLQHCLGLAFDQGKLYIADTYNNKIKVADPATRRVESFSGSVDHGSSDQPPRFYQPGGLSAANGALYVADTNNHLIRRIDLATKAVTTLPLTGVTPPAPPARKPTFRNALATTLEPVKVAPGSSLTLGINTAIPGFKLNDGTPARFLIEADPPSALAASIKPTGGTIADPTKGISLDVPLASPAKPGDTLTLTLSTSLFVCATDSGFCTVKNYTWTIPVQFAEGAPARIDLTTPAPKTTAATSPR